ncbi:MAG: amidohydrolase family protein [Xanthobacteraceae bacterium]
MSTIDRRDFVGGSAALGIGFAAPATLSRAQTSDGGPRQGLPARGEFVIRNAYVMTMDPILGDIPGSDVHVRGGEIVGVGKSLDAAGAATIDGQGMIVLPGLIETHWHMWTTLFRSYAGDRREHTYFPMVLAFTKFISPDDVYQGTRLGAVDALNSGITTVHNWAHSIRDLNYAEAELRALKDTGIRARFSYSWYQGMPDSEIFNLADLERLHHDWAKYDREGLLHLCLGWRGMWRATLLKPEVYRAEFEHARRLAIPIAVHLGSRRNQPRMIEMHAKEGFLGKDVLIAHATWAQPDEIKMLADTGSPVSLSPITDARVGYGFAPASELVAAGVTCCLSVDTVALTGTCSLFENMKFLAAIENARAESEFKLAPRRALEMGTIDGARALGIDDKVGSLKPGKRADLIMVSTREPNLGVFTDPAHMLVEATGSANIDTVVVDGRIMKRNGTMVGVAAERVVAEAAAALDKLRKQANWR